MDPPDGMAFLVIVSLVDAIGFLSSFFMIICLSVKEFQRKNMMPYIKILIPLNMSNMCYISVLSINFIIGLRWPDLYRKAHVYEAIYFLGIYSITSSLWLSAVLCVFYFLKIMPSQPGVLTTLKSQIGVVVWWLIITSEIVSLIGGFLSMLISNPLANQRNSSITVSELINEANSETMKFMDIVLLLNSLPFLVIMVTTIGSTGFLKLYDHQIQKNITTSGNIRVRDYREAIQTMIGLLALYSIILLCTILLMLNVFSYLSWGYCICIIFLFSCATILPALLIYGNPKLKEAIRQMFTP